MGHIVLGACRLMGHIVFGACRLMGHIVLGHNVLGHNVHGACRLWGISSWGISSWGIVSWGMSSWSMLSDHRVVLVCKVIFMSSPAYVTLSWDFDNTLIYSIEKYYCDPNVNISLGSNLKLFFVNSMSYLNDKFRTNLITNFFLHSFFTFCLKILQIWMELYQAHADLSKQAN